MCPNCHVLCVLLFFVTRTEHASAQCTIGYTGPDAGPCTACTAGTYKDFTGSAVCTACAAGTYSTAVAAIVATTCVACPSGQTSPVASSSSINCICPAGTVPFNDPLETILKVNPAYIRTSAEAWNSTDNRFTDLSGNARHGGLTAGMVTVGTVTGNGAGGSMPFVGGTTATKILWPAGSIPSTFTVCSITRYTGGNLGRILDCVGLNWLHGHWGGYAGSTHYNGPGNLNYGISPNTNWVVVCGRNTATAGAISTIVNDVVTSTSVGGTGNCQLIINQGELSIWQLSRLYIWNTHLSNSDFAIASQNLRSYMSSVSKLCLECPFGTFSTNANSTVCIACPAGTYTLTTAATVATACLACPANSNSPGPGSNIAMCLCNVGYTGPTGGPCTVCVAGTYKTTTSSEACTNCLANQYSTTVGATVATTCLACPSNSNSPSPSSTINACSCNPGYTGPGGGPCTACVAGKYKPTWGSAECTICESGKYSTTAGATSCTACEAGKYSTTVGATVVTTCIGCGVGNYSTSVDVTRCLTCPANSGSSCTTCSIPHCPCNAGYVGGNFISQYSTNGCTRFHALMTWKSSFASVSTRNNAAIGTLPTYNALGGPSGKGHVSFDSSKSQFLNTGARTMNIGTNGGFTIVIVMRWTGVIQTGQHICTSGNPRTWEIFRQSSTSIEFLWWQSNRWWRVSRGATMTQDVTWLTIVVRYNKNGQVFSTINGAGGTDGRFGYGDMNFDAIYLGRARGGGGHLNADVAGAFIVDELLTTDATNAITQTMFDGVDLTDTTCPSGNACTACADGTYKSTTGSNLCINCPANSASASTSCTCNAGYTPGFGYAPGTQASCTTTSRIERSCGALGGDACPASQSSTYDANYIASNALDGTIFTFSHTSTAFQNPTWWRLDFGRSMTVTNIIIYNRQECCPEQINGMTIAVGESPSVDVNAVCASNQPAPIVSPYMTNVTCPTPLSGRYVHISVYGINRYLHLAEVQVQGCGPGCPACATGTYKSATGSAACTPCVAGTYSTALAATAQTACLVCPVNSNSPIQSSATTACTCNAGHSGPNGGPCVPCAAGTYKPSTGPAACTSCPAFSGAACAACTLSTLCVCTGYTGNACTACVSASSPASTSASACVCGPGQYDAST